MSETLYAEVGRPRLQKAAKAVHLHRILTVEGCIEAVDGMKAATLLPLLFFVLFAFHGKTSEVRCNGPSLYNEGFCVCKWSCIGNQCQSGKSSKTGLRVRGYRLEACPECHCTEGSTTTSARKPRVLYMTVATHEEPFFELLQSSVSQLGKKLHMFGKGEFFKGPRRALCRILTSVRRLRLEIAGSFEGTASTAGLIRHCVILRLV